MPSELQRPPSSSTSHWATTTGRGWTMQVAAHTASTCILSSTTEEEFKLEFGLGNFEWINGPILTFLFIARCWQCFLLFFFFLLGVIYKKKVMYFHGSLTSCVAGMTPMAIWPTRPSQLGKSAVSTVMLKNWLEWNLILQTERVWSQPQTSQLPLQYIL